MKRTRKEKRVLSYSARDKQLVLRLRAVIDKSLTCLVAYSAGAKPVFSLSVKRLEVLIVLLVKMQVHRRLPPPPPPPPQNSVRLTDISLPAIYTSGSGCSKED